MFACEQVGRAVRRPSCHADSNFWKQLWEGDAFRTLASCGGRISAGWEGVQQHPSSSLSSMQGT